VKNLVIKRERERKEISRRSGKRDSKAEANKKKVHFAQFIVWDRKERKEFAIKARRDLPILIAKKKLFSLRKLFASLRAFGSVRIKEN
jgi:hypothetical protein